MKSTLNIFQKFFQRFSKKQLIIGSVSGLFIVGAVSAWVGGSGSEASVFVERGTIEEEVLVTGKTKSSAEVDLGFERSGRVSIVYKKVGERVSAGETLVVLDQADLRANLDKALADLRAEEIKLDSIKRTARTTYENAYDEALISLRDAYTRADGAVRSKADQFFKNPREYNAQFALYSNNNDISYIFNFYISEDIQRNLANQRVEIEETLVEWTNQLATIKNGDDLTTIFKETETNLNKVAAFLYSLSTAVNSTSSYYDSTYTTDIEGYKATASSARSDVITALSNLISAKEKLNTAPKILIGSNQTFDEVLSQESRVASLEASVSAARADLSKMTIISPISGVLTRIELEKGEIVSSGTSLISVVSDVDMQVEAFVSEVNIGKVKIGDKVSITLDAFPGEVYLGSVVYIDPGETILDGVAKYKTTVKFDGETISKIRGGFTSNLRIETFKKENVLKIPVYAVEKKGDSSIVIVKKDQKSEEREVETGLRGKDGSIEVLSGLSEGEEILISTK